MGVGGRLRNTSRKNKRGELGKPLFNWYFNRVGTEPIARISYPQSAADRRNTLQGVVTRAGGGAVNPQKIDVTDPQALTQHIKRVAEFFGADVVRIAKVHPSMLYSGSRYPDDGSGSADARGGANRDSAEVAEDFPYAKPNSWWRTLAVQPLKQTPIQLRSTVVRALKFLDDTF